MADSSSTPPSGEASTLPQLHEALGDFFDAILSYQGANDHAWLVRHAHDFNKALAEASALSFSSGDNSAGGTTICPACVVSDPRIRLCDVHKGEASALPQQDVIREAQIREARLRADALERAARAVHAVGVENVTLPAETVMAVAGLLHVLAIRVANQLGGEASARPPSQDVVWHAVYCEGRPCAAYPSRKQAEVYASGFSKPTVIQPVGESARPPLQQWAGEPYDSERPCGCNYARGEQIFVCPDHRVGSARPKHPKRTNEADHAPDDELVAWTNWNRKTVGGEIPCPPQAPEHRCGVRGFADSGETCPGCVASGRASAPPDASAPRGSE